MSICLFEVLLLVVFDFANLHKNMVLAALLLRNIL